MSLVLTELSLSHFRSHRAARLELDHRPVAIHGPNGAGKTNILEAVSLFSPGRGLRRVGAGEMARRPEALGWKVQGTVVGPGGTHQIETWSEAGAARQVRINDKPAPQIALGRIAPVLWLVPAMDRLWIEGADGRRRFLDRMTMSFIPDHADVALTYEKAMRERNRLLKDQVSDAGWYGALEAQMADAGQALHCNRLETLAHLCAAQAQAETAFPVAELELVTGEGDWSGDLHRALTQSRPRDMAAGRTLVGPHRSDLSARYAAKGVAARDCSTGEQKALLVSLILANARALAGMVGAPPILLLDEVAAHLDAARRAALYDEICGLGAQAWMTGTEGAVFADLGLRAQFVRVAERDGSSLVVQE